MDTKRLNDLINKCSSLSAGKYDYEPNNSVYVEKQFLREIMWYLVKLKKLYAPKNIKGE